MPSTAVFPPVSGKCLGTVCFLEGKQITLEPANAPGKPECPLKMDVHDGEQKRRRGLRGLAAKLGGPPHGVYREPPLQHTCSQRPLQAQQKAEEGQLTRLGNHGEVPQRSLVC